MSAVTDPHPSADDLAAFDAGCLPAARSAAVETHVAACASCCRRLEELPEDAFAALVRAYAGKADPGRTRPQPNGAAWEVPGPLVGHPRYRVLGVLGQGGMGVVYKAVQQHMDRVVALKVIHAPLLACPDFVERFRREVKAVARLRHPNIVLAHDADQAGELHFLVMEHVEGTSLDQVVARRGPLPVAEACEYARQAALGLQHAHEQGLVHRDVKPHNLLLTPQGQVKVVDFGLAHLARADGAETAVTSAPLLGTPDYTAPEQARDPSGVDVRADVYSLGCTLYHLLTGQPPFPGGTALQKLLNHQERPPRPVTELRPDVPPGLAALLGRMLAKDRARRPATPGEVASELAPFAGAPAETAALPPPRRRGLGRRGVLVGGAALAAVLAAGTLAAWWRGRPTVGAQEGPAARVESPSPGAPAVPPDVLGPDEVLRLKQHTRDLAVNWLRDNSPNRNLVRDMDREFSKYLPDLDGHRLTVGSRLLRSGKPTVLAARFGELFLFELTKEEEPAVGAPTYVGLLRLKKGHNAEYRRRQPRAWLSDLHIDNADRLPHAQRITGRVRFEGLQSVGPKPHLRMVYYPHVGASKCTGMHYYRPGLPTSPGELRFDMPAVREQFVPPERLMVVFFELASLRDGEPVIESNTLAALVRPLPPPGSAKGKP